MLLLRNVLQCCPEYDSQHGGFVHNQLKTMLELQNSMNTRVHEQWMSQGFEWYRAVWVECAELMDHYGWKWWKKQSPDVEQVKLELIDIWHFGLSLLLEQGVEVDDIATQLQEGLSDLEGTGDFRNLLESFAGFTLESESFNVVYFAHLMRGIDLDFDALYTGYVGKNVLNFFRQDHGYQEGSYQKNWDGKEDNEHLVELVQDLDSNQDDFKEQLYLALSQRYKTLCMN